MGGCFVGGRSMGVGRWASVDGGSQAGWQSGERCAIRRWTSTHKPTVSRRLAMRCHGGGYGQRFGLEPKVAKREEKNGQPAPRHG